MYSGFPANPGHTLVIPKRHIESFEDMNREEKYELADAVILLQEHLSSLDIRQLYHEIGPQMASPTSNFMSFISAALKDLKRYTEPPQSFNHGVNNGIEAGRTVNHLHYHVIPRWQGDVSDPKGGILNMFEGKGKYKQ